MGSSPRRMWVLGLVAFLGAWGTGVAAGEGPPAPEAPPELLVLRQLCRYLRLSRTQIGQLLPTARATERARSNLARQKVEVDRQLEVLQDRPEELQRLRQAWAEREARFRSDLHAFAGPQLVRILTREQVALIWALTGGGPPRYAGAEAALVDPGAGFAGSNRLRRYLVLTEKSAVEPQVLSGEVLGGYTRLQVPPGSGGVITYLQLDGGEFRVLPEGLRALGQSGDPERPFPQVVVETNEMADLLPAVEKFVTRAFSSPDWLAALTQAYRQGLGVKPSLDFRLVARKPSRPVRDYRMERGLRDLTGRGPALEPLGGALDHGAYLFGPGQGLRLRDTGVRDDYTIEFSFRYGASEGYQKLLDFKNGKADGGLYLYQGHLTFYTLANGGAPEPGKEHRFRLERDRETRVVRGFLDFRPVFAFIDLNDDAVFEGGTGLFFVDDATTKGEQGAGAVRWVSVRGPLAP